MANRLHIICLDVPFPADYGGAIDMFYRIQALHQLGLDLTLHVFHYGREKQSELEKYGEVIYYERRRSIWHLFSKRPFIVQSRISQHLLTKLRKDNSPILFEGIHTTWPLEMEDIRQRFTLVRMHNVEDEYYLGLRKHARWYQKWYFEQERWKLKNYVHQLKHAKHLFAIKQSDAEKLAVFHPSTYILPASIPPLNEQFSPVQPYALFHGNLSVPENEQAARWLIQTLKGLYSRQFPLIVAGKNPSKRLTKWCNQDGIMLKKNPTSAEMEQLVNGAQLHLLHTNVPSGVKLKLINCLASSGQVLVNEGMVEGTHLDQFCTVATDAKAFKKHFIGLQNKPLTQVEFDRRQQYLHTHFNTKENCKLIAELISTNETNF